MKFGIFYEHQLPRPWDEERGSARSRTPSSRSRWPTGSGSTWCGRSSTTSSRSTRSSAPEVFLAACSQRRTSAWATASSRPPRLQYPARTAERVAMLDLVSGGRVEFGCGESSSEAELGGLASTPSPSGRRGWRGWRPAVRCMTEQDAFTGVDGTFVSMPPRNVVPKPVQKPHPPLWVACSRRDTILLAAEKGIGALAFAFIDPEEAVQWVTDYEQTLAVRAGRPVGQRQHRLRHPDDARGRGALHRGLEGGNFFGSLGHYYIFGEHEPGRTDVWAEFVERRRAGLLARVHAALEAERLGAKQPPGTPPAAGRHRHPGRSASTCCGSRRPASTRSSS